MGEKEMNTKRIVLLAVMFALPITANAEYTYDTIFTPKMVANGMVTIANSAGPYQIATIEDNDDEHIASTAYVKGAYNDTIAAVNKIADVLKRTAFNGYDSESNEIETDLISADEFLGFIVDDDIESMKSSLMTAYGVAVGLRSQRVEVYTTWDDDTATTDVAFKTVVP